MLLIAIAILVAMTAPTAAAPAPTAAPATVPAITDVPAYGCRPTTAPVIIEGKLDDAAWTSAEWTRDFLDIEGADNPPPPLRTRAKLRHDQRHLYVAVALREPDVRGVMRRRDDRLYRENAFELFLDPDDDGREYLELEINALGTIFDLVMNKPYRDGGRMREAWTIEGLKSAVAIDGTVNDPSDRDAGWTIELAIPWEAIRELSPRAVPPKPGARWRMNLARVQHTRDQQGPKVSTWSPQGEINLHGPDRWGYLVFEAPPKP